jgi:histidinol dehydrogenase
VKRLRFGTPGWRRYVTSLPRSGRADPRVDRVVAAVLRAVRQDGDRALIRLTARFDGVQLAPGQLRVPATEIRRIARRADPELVAALRAMAVRIEVFHRPQKGRDRRLRLRDGTLLEEIVRPLDSVGLYVPGGAGAYPSSVLMNAIPAQVAGVPRIVVVTPPRALQANPAVAAALVIAGLEDSVYRIGGAQAVAALAYGTRSIPAVSKIVGPGNVYVAAAKREVRGRVEIDREAGPSEVVILADETADAGWVAVDLLAQAEHGSGREVVALVTPSAALAEAVSRRVASGVGSAANRRATQRALRRHGAVVLVRDLEQGAAAVNALAPEHVELHVRGASSWARRITAGAVFVGPYAPAAVGDYGIGPNHVLPTGGSARFASPLSVRDFERRQSHVYMTRQGLRRVGPGIARVAHAEGFAAHAQSVRIRYERRPTLASGGDEAGG